MCSSIRSYSQTDSISSGVYSVLPNHKIHGPTSTLTMLDLHTSTLAPGRTNHPARALMNREELVIVKEGSLTLIINDSSKILGKNGIALIMAGDTQSFSNHSSQPVSYYVIGFTPSNPADTGRGKHNGGSLVKNWNELTVKKTTKGESRAVLDKPSSAFGRFDVHATTLNEGQESHPEHTHPQEEIMFLMKGNVTMHIDGKNVTANEGNAIFIRPNIPHHLTNTGSTPCWYYAIKWYTGVN
ncbi:MAG: cupin domain-containing protein [Bacteroidota bacterium]|nr:cupin domain-containing protein [Bacteroidota bacterium]